MARTTARCLRAALACSLLLSAATADAQHGEKDAAAEALFQEGQSLVAQQRYAEACPKLLKSFELVPNGGTLFNLAGCYEANGQFASAWAAYKKVESRAADAGKANVEKAAAQKAAALETKLTRLAIRLSDGADVPDLEVRQNGEIIDRATWGSELPIDPGSRTFTVSARGRKPWTQTVEVAAETKRYELVVPVLEIDPEANKPEPAVAPSAAAPSATAPQEDRGKTLRVVGLVAAGVGVATLGTGLFFGSQASSKEDDIVTLRRSGGAWDQSAYDAGKTDAMLGTVLIASGAAVMATGAVLFVVGMTKKGEPAAPASAMRLNVTPGLRATSVGASWQF